MEKLDKRKIAHNTALLYFRMIFVMVVSLYTSRVVLEYLGIDNFGIYQTVGGVVGMLTFVNTALSTGISRFLTFELGHGDEKRLRRTFSTTLTVQLGYAAVLYILGETVGLWFLENKLLIEPSRMWAARWVYQISLLNTAISLLTVPYTASVMAHEKMNVFAYLGIFDVCAKLGIVYLLGISTADKLVFYASLLLGIQLLYSGFYFFYCSSKFSEARFSLVFDKKIFKEVAGFSGWSLFAAASIALNNQGVLLLLNMFFSPAVVAARAISLQVNNATNQFVANFRTAANPQIVKQYAAGNLEESKNLLLSSTKYSYFLMFILSLPIFICSKQLLEVWLTEVPEYTVIFLQIVIIQSLFQVFDSSFYMALYAKGDLKVNALISPTLGFFMFPIVYILFRNGASPVALSWANLIFYAILGLVVKPILLVKIVDYTWKDIFMVFRPCLIVSVVAAAVALFLTSFIDLVGFLSLVVNTAICLGVTLPAIYYLGMSYSLRKRLKDVVLARIRR